MSTPTTFVVLTTQRTGSSWLVDLLNDHPAVVAYAEVFRVTDTTVSYYGAREVPRFEAMVPRGIFSVSRQLVRRRYDYVRGLVRAHPGVGAVGFKLMYDQTRDHPGLLAILALRRARVIHLVRRDHVGALVSFDVAEQLDRWHYQVGQAVPRRRVRVEPEELARRVQERAEEVERYRRRLRRLPVRVLDVVYEDLVARREEVLAEILGFLRVTPTRIELASSLVQTRPERLADAIENLDELQPVLGGVLGPGPSDCS